MDLNRKKYSRIAAFSSGEKINLINKIKEEPVLWDLNHNKHYDAFSSKTAWDRVAVELDKDVNDCRSAWKSLRDSYRYHTAKSKSRAGAQEADKIDWQFAPYMAFLPDFSNKKSSNFTEETEAEEFSGADSMETTFLEPDTISLGENELQLHRDLSEVNESLYSYGKRRRFEETDETPAQRMVDMFGRFLQACPAPPAPAQSRPVFAYWESLLKKLTPEDADAAEREITQLLWEKTSFIQN